MNNPQRLTWTFFAFVMSITVAGANERLESLMCASGYLHNLQTTTSAQDGFAPDRLVDVLHVKLDVTPDYEARSLSATAKIDFRPIGKALRELTLDAVDLDVQSVTSSEPIQSHQVTLDKIIITFSQPIAPERQAYVVIRYTAEPKDGLYFRTPAMGYPEGDTHLFTQGEPEMHRHWFPSHDFPNEKFTSEVICHVPQGMTVLSNGRLLSQETDAETGLVAFHWRQEKPHANYLISLVAGYFEKLEDTHQDTPLALYTPPSEFAVAANSFRDTKDIMDFYESEIGVPYPWAKYYNVAVHGFMWGGMENTSVTTLTTRTLFSDATENLLSSRSLDAHEMAHQWFGDLVTCKDWSHIWLNEGFATYYAALYEGHRFGRDALLYTMHTEAQEIFGQDDDVRPIHSRVYDDPMDQFRNYGYLAYNKGSWVLHMLRGQLGDDLYRRCIQTYLERNQFGSVVTEDLNSVIEELSGRSFDRFFDQWVFHAHYPELDVSYAWDETSGLARVSVSQVQEQSDDVLSFQFPLSIRFKTGSLAIDKQVVVTKTSEDFYFRLDEKPAIVRIDPEFALLATINFDLPTPMLMAQLDDDEDMIGRLLAARQIGSKKNQESVDRLATTLTDDPFFGVRLAAAEALVSIHSEEALQALIESRDQDDARVRLAVTTGIAGFYRDESYDALSGILATEANPNIQAEALRALGKYPRQKVQRTLLESLNSESFRNGIADAAISAMRSQDDPAYIEPLLEYLKASEAKFTEGGYSQALRALAFLARNEEQKNSVREFLTPHVNHPKQAVQTAAIGALGALGDSKAIPILQTFASADPEAALTKSAQAAVKQLRDGETPQTQLKDLRTEVLELDKDLRRMNEEISTLKTKLSAEEADDETNADGDQ